MTTFDNNFINHFIYKGTTRNDWDKYILLEKLLSAKNKMDIDSKKNTGYFTCQDAAQLIQLYKIKKLYRIYSDECAINHYEHDYSNFKKMIHPDVNRPRNPNISLINSLITVILDGSISSNKTIYVKNHPLEMFDALSNRERQELLQYIIFCKAVSIIKNEHLKEWNIDEGNQIIQATAIEMKSKLIPLLTNPVFLSRYLLDHNVFEYDIELEDSAYKSAIEDIYTSMSCDFPYKNLEEYRAFEENASNLEFTGQLLSNLPDSTLLWINAHARCIFSAQDKYFLQLIFLLLFVPSNSLGQYTNYISPFTLNIPKGLANNYYKDVQRILMIPPIEGLYNYDEPENRTFAIFIINNIYFTNIATWLKFALCNISEKVLDAAKNLYYMIFIRHRYCHQEGEDSSFPTEIINLIKKDNPDIEKIYKLCKCPPFV